ncbi:MAG: hypothetical protein H6Q97_84, partial [Nitrospirae bacterium]|nr:hypothetical protein [Nitrospirota bacterium]
MLPRLSNTLLHPPAAIICEQPVVKILMMRSDTKLSRNAHIHFIHL